MPYNYLKEVPLFAAMPAEDLIKVSQTVDTLDLSRGEYLFMEGSEGDNAFVVKSGEIEILKESNGREVLLAVRGAKTLLGEMSLLESTPRTATIRARQDCQLLVISKESLDKVLHSSPTAMQSIFKTILNRLRDNQQQLQQSEKMALLGTFTAGIAHELNNPAATMQRGAEQLGKLQSRLKSSFASLVALNLSSAQMKRMQELADHVENVAGQPTEMDALVRSEKEEELEGLLERHGIEETWELAPAMIDLGCDEAFITILAEEFQGIPISEVIEWLGTMHNSFTLLNEITAGGQRVSEIVSALKSYSFHDQAPVVNVDVNKGLDDTLIILHHRIKHGISVTRNYHQDLPHIMAYGSELNQVWTNIIDNAIQVLDSANDARIDVRTSMEGDWVKVEIQDNGPGIPLAHQSKIFDSFFTTKEPGKGTGLGLNISYNIIQKHHGNITVSSLPGQTCFSILLPLNFNNN